MASSFHTAAELSRALARHAEAVCRHYLPKGRKEGRYWLVGDTSGTPGRSMFVRLSGPDFGKGAAGKWTDAQSGAHGDLLDLIALNRGFGKFRDTANEARRFLSLPLSKQSDDHTRHVQLGQSKVEAARRLFAASVPIAGTRAAAYLRCRGIDIARIDCRWLRFHPRCWYRDHDAAPLQAFAALIAAVTDNDGRITGVHRTWLDPNDVAQKAPVAVPRRAMGDLLGNGVRFGCGACPRSTVAVGEGLESILSISSILPYMPMIAALSANHLAAFELTATLGRLYIVLDADPAGRRGADRLRQRALEQGIEVYTLTPKLGDFNEDIRKLGSDAIALGLRDLPLSGDAYRF